MSSLHEPKRSERIVVMRQLSLTSSLLVYLDELEFTEAGLSASADAAVLALPVQAALAAWPTVFGAQRQARRAVVRTQAVVAVQNDGLDRKTMQFSRLARGYAPALVADVFGARTPAKFVRLPLRIQCDKTRNVMLAEIEKLGTSHPLAPFYADLDSLTKATLAALDARTKAHGDRNVTANATRAWKQSVNDLRTTTYAELVKIATEKKYHRSWADTFFASPSEEEELETETETEETAPQ